MSALKTSALISDPAPRESSAARWLPAAQRAATLALMLLSAAQGLAMIRVGALHGNDFKHLWLGAWLIVHGLNPYDPAMMFKAANNFGLGAINPFVYLPSTGWLLAPLAGLRFEAAKLAWFALNWLAAWGCVWLAPRALRLASPARARLAGAAFLCASFPFYRQMSAGQMNVMTAALLLGSAALFLRRRDAWCGALLALGFAWKIAPALMILALLPLRRPRGFAVGVAACLGLVVVMFAVTDYDTFAAGFATMGEMGYGRSTWAQQGMDFYRDPFNQSINSLLHHLFTVNPYTKPWSVWGAPAANALTMLATLGLALGWLLALWNQLPYRHLSPWPEPGEQAAALRLFWAAAALMLLAPSLMWDHYMVQLLPALMWLFGGRALGRSAWRAVLALAIMAGLCVPWLYAAPAFRAGAGVPLMSLRLWPALALYGWLLLDRRLADAPQQPDAALVNGASASV